MEVNILVREPGDGDKHHKQYIDFLLQEQARFHSIVLSSDQDW